MAKVESLTVREKRALQSGLDQIIHQFYFIPGTHDILLEAGRFYQLLGEYEKARACYQNSMRYFGESWTAFHNLGLVHYFLDDPQNAATFFEKALRVNPEAKDSREWVGFLKNEGLASHLVN